jgi:hypothetical protein
MVIGAIDFSRRAHDQQTETELSISLCRQRHNLPLYTLNFLLHERTLHNTTPACLKRLRVLELYPMGLFHGQGGLE